jgi:hypothetical protein
MSDSLRAIIGVGLLKNSSQAISLRHWAHFGAGEWS